VVEDARALGKRLLLSDIPVHREQNPDGALYFDPHAPEQLADLLQLAWNHWPAGPDRQAERRVEADQQARILSYAHQFLRLAREAVGEPATHAARPH
jgi:hypothetical protein